MTDPNAGKGGSYVRDPETGERKLVERTALPQPVETEKPTIKAAKPADKGNSK